MAYDGIFMAALAVELRGKLTGGRVDKIYQPEADTLIIGLRCDRNNYRLKLSASASMPYVSLTETKPENPQQPPMFCMLLRKHLTGARLITIRQNGLERILDFVFDTYDELGNRVERILCAEIMGRHSNIIFYQADNRVVVDSVKRISSAVSRVRQIYPGIVYQLPPGGKKDLREVENQMVLTPDATETGSLQQWLLSNYQGFSPSLSQQLCFEANVDPDQPLSELSPASATSVEAVLRRLKQLLLTQTLETRLILDQTGKPVDMTAAPLFRLEISGHLSPVTEPTLCVNRLFEQRDQQVRLDQKAASMKKVVETRLERMVNKKSHLESDLLQAEDAERQRQFGELLLANVYRLTKGDHQAAAENFFEEGSPEIVIPMDVRLSPVENAQRYFRKYTKLRNSEAEILSQLEQTAQEIQYLESVLLLMEQSSDPGNLEAIRAELAEEGYLKSRGRKKDKRPKSVPMRFLSSEGFEILVGRNNVQNDELTLKTASNKDLWFHTKSVPGSHVVIRTQGKTPGEQTLREAAVLAAWHSKGRMSGQVPVDYTEIRHVSKPSGAKPGMVIYVQNKTIFVTPDEEEVKKLMATSSST
jgi:predicted ribosome quality control (RQC) complex YloA/Tae2 family protein